MTIKSAWCKWGVALTAVTAFAAAPAFAADSDTATSTGASEGELQEVVVTAEKHSTDVQKTPIAMTVVQGAAIEQAGVVDMKGLSTLAPEINVVTNTVYTQIGIRGVSSQDITETADPAITVGIDGEYLGHPIALNTTMFDISRVEVLRGPQGTLYGKDSTGGSINIITNKPDTSKFSGMLSAGGGNYSTFDSQGVVNIPLSDTFAVRAAFMTSRHGGYTDNAPAGHGDTGDVKAARVGFLFDTHERFSAYLAGEYVNIDQSSQSQFGIPVAASDADASGQFAGAPAHFNPSLPTGSGYPLPSIGTFKSNQSVLRGQLNYRFDWATLTYVGGYRDSRTSALQPLQGYITSTSFGFSADDNTLNFKTQNHELRLSGGSEATVFWQAGVFYSWDVQDVESGIFLPANTVPAFFPPFLDNAYVNYFLLPRITSSSTAEFGQISAHMTDQLKLKVGARYTHDAKTRFGYVFPFGFAMYPNRPTMADVATTSGVAPDGGSGTWNKLTWMAGLDYQLAADNLLYAKVATGYKSGGFDNFVAQFGPYKPESLTDYEVGSKNRLWNERLQVNVGAFYYDYTNLQTPVFLSTTGGSHTENAGKAKEYGLETDLLAALTKNDTVRLTANYLFAQFEELNASMNLATSGASAPVSLAKKSPIQAPKWTIAAGINHKWQLPNAAVLAIDLSTRYKSDYYLTAFNWQADRQSAHTISDASLTYSSDRDVWDVSAYVHDIENKRELDYSAFTGGGINVYNWIFGPPRTFGGRVAFHW
jgi:iron complex outermembrane recepter protein